jgi:hypothetical protein
MVFIIKGSTNEALTILSDASIPAAMLLNSIIPTAWILAITIRLLQY